MTLDKQIQRDATNHIVQILAPNGMPSILFNEIKTYLKESDYERKTNLKRLPPEVEQNNIARGEKNARTAYFLRRHIENPAELQREHTKERQEALVEELAKKENFWVEDWTTFREKHTIGFLDRGEEAKAYIAKNCKEVYKILNYSVMSDTPMMFLDRWAISNHLFQAARVDVIGVTRESGKLQFIIKQPFIIKDESPLEKEEIGAFMQEIGFKHGYENSNVYYNDIFTVDDLHKGNIFRGIDGQIYIIDAVTELHTKDETDFIEGGGKMEYDNSELEEESQEDMALNLWKLTYTDRFQLWLSQFSTDEAIALDENGEPRLEAVLAFLVE